jgi:hypothetical protein
MVQFPETQNLQKIYCFWNAMKLFIISSFFFRICYGDEKLIQILFWPYLITSYINISYLIIHKSVNINVYRITAVKTDIIIIIGASLTEISTVLKVEMDIINISLILVIMHVKTFKTYVIDFIRNVYITGN